MYEENKSFSLTNFFIKAIIVIIFVLFTVWLLSLSNKGISNSLDVLTDNIFAENIDRMKEVGKEYFTTERLPQKVGDVKTITLQKMYDEHLILTVKDKNGKACSAKNSYVSIEKMENEYQMKVYLECGEESDYIVVIMGCYDYCDTDICEVKETTSVDKIEYEYKKTTGGYWTDYGKWTDWSKVSVTETNYRDVEVKTEKEDYSYQKDVVEKLNTGNATCPAVSGYTLVSNTNGVCKYEKSVTSTKNPICPTLDGYTVTRAGFTCNYSKKVTDTKNPVCSTLSGYTYVSRNGFTCNYSRTVTSDKEYDIVYSHSGNGYPPSDTDTYHYELASSEYVFDCTTTCSARWVYTYRAYKKVYKTSTETKTATASCPTGYNVLNGTCSKTTTLTDTKTASCPTGYSVLNGTCSKTTTLTDTKTASCPSGYKASNNTCTKVTVLKETKTASCPTGETMEAGKCYKEVTSKVTVTGTKDVKYYRYRLREYKGGTVDYKWSTSKNDKDLLNAGYKLTGKTR